MHDQINSRRGLVLWVLFAASGLLFVIACSNVANLILARAVRREPEMAIRSALGATTGAFRRSLLAEGIVLVRQRRAGWELPLQPRWCRCSRTMLRASLCARSISHSISAWSGLVSALALIAAVFLAFVPRLPAPDSSAAFGLSSSGVRVSGGSSRRLGIFAVTQITASFLLLAGAGALVKTLLELEKTQPPFDTAHVLAVNLPVMSDGRTPEQVRDFYRDVQRRDEQRCPESNMSLRASAFPGATPGR